MTIQPQQNRR